MIGYLIIKINTTNIIFHKKSIKPMSLSGYLAFEKYLAESLDYPDQPIRLGISVRIFVRFTSIKSSLIALM